MRSHDVVACTQETHLFFLWGEKVHAQRLNTWTLFIYFDDVNVFPPSSHQVLNVFTSTSECVTKSSFYMCSKHAFHCLNGFPKLFPIASHFI